MVEIFRYTQERTEAVLQLQADLQIDSVLKAMSNGEEVADEKNKTATLAADLSLADKAVLLKLLIHFAYSRKDFVSMTDFQPMGEEFLREMVIDSSDVLVSVEHLQQCGLVTFSNNELRSVVSQNDLPQIFTLLAHDVLTNQNRCSVRLDVPTVSSIILVATENGETVGFISGCVLASSESDKTAEIWELSVKPQSRGKGIGTQLINAFKEQSRKMGAYYLKVSTSLDNPDGIKFYEKNGFKKETHMVHLKQFIWE